MTRRSRTPERRAADLALFRSLMAPSYARQQPWTGDVVRRDPSSYQRRSVILTWRCANCRSWTMRGSYLTGRCNFCATPRASRA